MNKHGSGVTHYDEYKSDEMMLFGGGLRSDRRTIVKDHLHFTKNHHDKMSYARGTISHSRSAATQYFNFHYLYGGPKKFFIDRWLYQVLYKRVLRSVSIPIIVVGSCELKSPSFDNENVR